MLSSCSLISATADRGLSPTPQIGRIIAINALCTACWIFLCNVGSSVVILLLPERVRPDSAPAEVHQPIRWWTGLKRRLSSFAQGSVH